MTLEYFIDDVLTIYQRKKDEWLL